MRLYFGGGEVPGHRKILVAANVATVSLSFVGLKRRVKHPLNWDLTEKFPGPQLLFLDSGAYSLNRADAEYTEDEALSLANEYMAFVAQNIDRVEMVSEFDARILGRDWLEGVREDFWEELPEDKYMPIWHAEDGTEELERLASRYKRVGVLQAELASEGPTASQLTLNSLSSRYGVLLHGVAMTQMDAMREIRWDSVGSTTWLAPSQYGETHVWAGNKLTRYPKKYKETSRNRHRSVFTDNGFDVEKIAADDPGELLRLSLWSWQQFVADIERNRLFSSSPATGVVTTGSKLDSDGFGENDTELVGTPGGEAGNGELVPLTRETYLLPILNAVDAPVKEGVTEPRLEIRGTSMRVCDRCFIKDKCPAFQPSATCAYSIPVELNTTTQVRQLRKLLVGMQAQRAVFMAMIEQLNGGYADANTSAELDRAMRMMRQDAEADKTGVKLMIETTGDGNAGMISRIFGQDTETRMNALEAPVKADDEIAGSEIWEADVISESAE